MASHHQLGMRPDAHALVIDDGCGGTPYVMDMACRMISSGAFKTIAVVGAAFTSPLVDRETFTQELSVEGHKPLNAYLSMYVFGDGAGAVILRGSRSNDRGVIATMAGAAQD